MSTRLPLPGLLAPLAAVLLLPAAAPGAPGRTAAVPRHDLADAVAGTYRGDVISDARGASRSDVGITVAKVGPNQVRVTSDYARLPAFTATLTRAMDTIQNQGGDAVFLYDPTRTPPTLMVSVADASWSGSKRN
jgi:hypothetical protein